MTRSDVLSIAKEGTSLAPHVEITNKGLWTRHKLISEQRRRERPVNPRIGTPFKQELARLSNEQRFVYYEHIVVGVMQFDDSRIRHA